MERLKRQIGKLELPTAGRKNELQRRLREELQHQGIDIDFYEFSNPERYRHKFVASRYDGRNAICKLAI